MKASKGVMGVVAAAAVAASIGAFAAAGFADGEYYADYKPTTVGNDYGNHVDMRNGVVVDGINAVMSISKQNSQQLEVAKGLATTMGSEQEGATPTIVTNMTGKDIDGIAVKTSSKSGFGDNLLSGSLGADEQACWWFVYPGYTTHEYTNTTGNTYTVPDNYTLEATFGDGTKGQFHNLNMNGVRTVNLRYSDAYEVYYVERTTITNHTPDPNLYYEVNMKEGEEGGGDAFDFHVNSAARMGDRQITVARGGGWELSHEPTQELENFSLALPLYGEPWEEYTNGVYEDLYWNAELLRWRDFDFE